MRWQKLGLIFNPCNRFDWMQTHAAVPIALKLNDNLYRIFFGTRDKENHSSVGFVDIDINTPKNIINISRRPVLTAGPLGYFDDNGVYPGCIVRKDSKLFMYYIGRNNGEFPLYYMSIGLAVSEDGGNSFYKVFKSPLMTRSEYDPWMVSTPFVIKDGNKWRMWYLSGIGWDKNLDNKCSYYHIKYAESSNGIDWERNGLVCIDLKEDETNIACPSVQLECGIYKMWYSYVTNKIYQIGFAESSDGFNWIRKDEEVGIGLSAHGWDSNSMSYPNVFFYKDMMYMLYCGNDFGRDGFGIAVREEC